MNATGSYLWSTPANWSAAVPTTSGYAAMFNMPSYLFSGANVTVDVDQAITVAGLRLVSGGSTGSLTLSNSTITLNGGANFSSGSWLQATGLASMTINNNLTLANTNGTTFQTGLAGAASGVWFKGVISGSSNITQTGSGYVFFGGSNTFSGNVAFNGGEYLATAANAFSSASAGTYTFASTGTTNFGTTASGTTAFNNAINFNGKTNDMKIFSGGTGSTFEITSSALSNATGTGKLLIERMISNSVVGYTANGVGTVKFSGTGYTIAKDVSTAGNSMLELAPASGTQTWSGNFTGFSTTNSIKKSGAGTVILGGTNTYTSQTFVNAGTLLINGTHVQASQGWGGASPTAGIYEVASGGTLGGTGRIAGNDTRANTNMVLVKSGGIIAPGGTGIGTLTLDGVNIGGIGLASQVLNMASGSKFSFRLAGNGTSADHVDFWNYANGDLLLSGGNIAVNLTLSGLGDGASHTVTLFKFYSNSGTTAFSGANLTTGLALGTVDPSISGTPTFNYYSDRIDLTYFSVPEPGTWVLLALSGTFFMVMRRRRQE